METIKSSTEISFLFSKGKRLKSSCITIIVYMSNGAHDPRGRVAFIAGKKNGGAVWRNRAKRRLREIARELGAPWPNCDVVFIAKPSTTTEKYSKVLQQARKLLAGSVGN